MSTQVSKVTRPDGKTFTVKNLGWLLRHWKEVRAFDLNRVTNRPTEGRMDAYLEDGTVYTASWASYDIMLKWVKRPRFKGLPGTMKSEPSENNITLAGAVARHRDALKAIRALINGEWDHPALIAFGSLSTNETENICRIIEESL